MAFWCMTEPDLVRVLAGISPKLPGASDPALPGPAEDSDRDGAGVSAGGPGSVAGQSELAGSAPIRTGQRAWIGGGHRAACRLGWTGCWQCRCAMPPISV